MPGDVFLGRSKQCEACGAQIWFWRNPATGRLVPVNGDSTSHFTSCTHPERFGRKGGKGEAQERG